MKLPQTFPLTLLFLSCLECNPSKKGRDTSEKGKPSFPWAQSGQFSTRDKHLCSWQLISGERDTELQLTCQPAEGEAQRCVYRGQPELCEAYGAKGRQFWKQILGKLRRKHHPCQDASPLKSRLCSSKETSEAHLHLIQTTPSADIPVATASVTQGTPKGKSHGKNLPASQRSPQAHQDMIVTKPAKNGALRKQKKGGKRKGNPNSPAAPTHSAHRQPTTAAVEGTVRPTELNADVADAYCEEKWHSLCTFFVNFWNG